MYSCENHIFHETLRAIAVVPHELFFKTLHPYHPINANLKEHTGVNTYLYHHLLTASAVSSVCLHVLQTKQTNMIE